MPKNLPKMPNCRACEKIRKVIYATLKYKTYESIQTYWLQSNIAILVRKFTKKYYQVLFPFCLEKKNTHHV